MLANMTMYTASGELIISLQRFRTMLKSVQCGDTMVLTFVDNDSFQYAIRAWNWVNEDETHSFILIADDPGCGPDDQRAPFYITDVDYDEQLFTVHLYGSEKKWEEVAHTFDLEYGTVWGAPRNQNNGSDLSKRFGEWGTTKGFSVPLTNNLDGNIFNEEIASGRFRLDCTDCGISGSLDVTFKVRVEVLVPVEISMTISPRSVHADLGLKLDLLTPQAPHPVSLSYSKSFLDIPIPAWDFEIPEIGGFATHFKGKIGVSVSKVRDEMTVEFGTVARLQDSAVAKLDLVNVDDGKFSGWQPSFQAKPFHLSNNISADVGVYLQWTLGPQFTLFGKGLEAALVLKLPDFKIGIDQFDSAESACAKEKKDGTSIDLSVGAALALRAGTRGDLSITADITDKPVFGGSAPIFGGGGGKRSLESVDSEEISAIEKRELEDVGSTGWKDLGATDVAISNASLGELNKRWSIGDLGMRVQLTLWVSKKAYFTPFCFFS